MESAMIVERGECRNLVSWLIGQEKVLRLWIDEIAAASTDADFILKLESHRAWLAERIDELAERAA